MERPNNWTQLIGQRTLEEQRLYAQVKRFHECLIGDPNFRMQVEKDPQDTAVVKRLKAVGVTIDPCEMAPLWQGLLPPETNFENMTPEDIESLREQADAELDRWPLVKLWALWRDDLLRLRFKQAKMSTGIDIRHDGFNAWHRRQIAAVKSELGAFGHMITYPLFAYELSSGCSVGCWFCGFASKKLQGVFPYNEKNRLIWREVIQTGIDIFGREAVRGLCYYGTEPADNPDYLLFLKDMNELAGMVASTSMAAPLKDVQKTREILDWYEKLNIYAVRFSVLSTSMLHRIHDIFSPDELRNVEVLMQMRHMPVLKARSGRTLHLPVEKLSEGPFTPAQEPNGSIACVSGFLVNMVEGTIQLVSPCQATDRWPLGYRVFAERTFNDGDSYRAAILEMLSTHVREHVSRDMLLRFRDDIVFEGQDDAFVLKTQRQEHRIAGPAFTPKIGKLIANGAFTFSQTVDALSEFGANPLAVSATVSRLFNEGLLDETIFGSASS